MPEDEHSQAGDERPQSSGDSAADPNGDSNSLVLARLEQLERAFGEQSARLRAIERRLGLVKYEPQPRPFAQGTSSGASAPTADDAPGSTQTRENFHASANENREAAPHQNVPAQEPVPSHEAAPAQEDVAAHTADVPSFASTPRAGGTWQETGAKAGDADTGETQEPPRILPARRDLEQLIGGSLFNWLGIIAVTLTVGFFLKYAFENQWIGPRGRVLLGGAVGCAILGAAERLRLRGYRSYAYVISGGGILILYLTVYAARVFYDLVGVLPAFLLMIAVTTTAVLLSARYNAYAIAVLGLIGGFMTPVLLSTGVDNQIGLFGYIALLNSGVLALAYFKRWRSLNHLAFYATVLMFAAWGLTWYDVSKFWPTLFFLTLFFLMFSAVGIIYNVVKLRPARWFDISLIITNATLYFTACYALLDNSHGLNFTATEHHPLLGLFALALSGFYVLLFLFTYQRHRADKLLTLSYVGAAVTFLTLAVAIQFDQHWVTIAWAMEGLMLTWIGLRSDTDAPRYAALPVFAFAVGHWFTTDMLAFAYRANETFVPLLNRRAVSAAALVAALAVAVRLYRREGEQVDADEREIISTVLVLAANILALTLLTIDVNDYFNARLAGLPQELDYARAPIENTRQFALTVLWTLYAAAALAVGLVRRLLPLRFAALLLLGGAIFKLLAIDLGYYSAPEHWLIFNQTFIACAVVVVALACVVRLYARHPQRANERERQMVVPLLIVVANLVAVVGLSAETLGYFNREKSLAWASGKSYAEQLGFARNVENSKQMILTFVWTIYAVAAFVVGHGRGRKFVRLGALLLLAATGIKILVLDAAYYASPAHTLLANQTFASFALYVLALWYVAHLYARSAAEVDAEELRLVRPALAIAGNLFALVALSLEASGYFNSQLRNAALTAEDLRNLRLAQGLSLSIVWTLYGGAMLLYGHARKNRLLRIMALVLLTVTAFKVFFLDLAVLEKFYRIVSFLVLGAILLAVSFLYQQKQRSAAKAESDVQ